VLDQPLNAATLYFFGEPAILRKLKILSSRGMREHRDIEVERWLGESMFCLATLRLEVILLVVVVECCTSQRCLVMI